jgi:Zn-dependent protease
LTVSSLSASINLFNLIPVWQLDGARGLRALSRSERAILGVVGLFLAVQLRQWMPAVVGAIALARALPSGPYEASDRGVLGMFIGLLVAHALVAAWAA